MRRRRELDDQSAEAVLAQLQSALAPLEQAPPPSTPLGAMLSEGVTPVTVPLRTHRSTTWTRAVTWTRTALGRRATFPLALAGVGLCTFTVGAAANELPRPVQSAVADVVEAVTPLEVPRPADRDRPRPATPATPATPGETPATPAVPATGQGDDDTAPGRSEDAPGQVDDRGNGRDEVRTGEDAENPSDGRRSDRVPTSRPSEPADDRSGSGRDGADDGTDTEDGSDDRTSGGTSGGTSGSTSGKDDSTSGSGDSSHSSG